ncbi:MAG: hypothetical protein D4S01_07280 [Dehalococcoidia bacterium]|nr:MAG: hypothetical protein D4S01_07280 [Dehalococcoidia bacterium]
MSYNSILTNEQRHAGCRYVVLTKADRRIKERDTKKSLLLHEHRKMLTNLAFRTWKDKTN